MYDWIKDFFESQFPNNIKTIVLVIIAIIIVVILSVKGKNLYDKYINAKPLLSKIENLENEIKTLKTENERLKEEISIITNENHSLKSSIQNDINTFCKDNKPMSISEDEAIMELISKK